FPLDFLCASKRPGNKQSFPVIFLTCVQQRSISTQQDFLHLGACESSCGMLFRTAKSPGASGGTHRGSLPHCIEVEIWKACQPFQHRATNQQSSRPQVSNAPKRKVSFETAMGFAQQEKARRVPGLTRSDDPRAAR